MGVASVLFTSLLIFRSLSATFEQYAVSFEDRMTFFINLISSLLNVKFFVALFRPLESIYSFLSNILSHINFGRVAVQCQGSQSAIELFGNIILIMIVFIVVEAEYAVILLNLKELTGNYIRASLLDRIFHGYRYYLHLLISVFLHTILNEINPVQLSVQFIITIVNIEQFYTFEYYGHSYSSFCNSHPGFINIDAFMAYGSTAVTTFLMIPLIVIILKLMVPVKVVLKGNEDGVRLDDDVDFPTLYKRVKNTDFAILKEQLPEFVFLNDKLAYYDSVRQENFEKFLAPIKSYLVTYAPVVSEILRVTKGVMFICSPDIAAVRVFMIWAASVLRSIEYEQILSDSKIASILLELDNKHRSLESTARLTDSSREIVDRFSIIDANFWKFTGKFIDDDSNHAAFKAEEENKRLSFYELMLQESKELPPASSLLELFVYLIQNLFTLFTIITFILGILGHYIVYIIGCLLAVFYDLILLRTSGKTNTHISH